MFETPILFLVFNRLDTTKQVFEQIRLIQPARLYIAADGPRNNVPEDFAKCESVKQFLDSAIDWPCEVKTLFRDENLGCGIAVNEAITWFFRQEEQGIVLEDDCLPNLSFFRYCEELLNLYKSEERVMMVSGFSGVEKFEHPLSYSFSVGGAVWGWATWRRAWELNDFFMTSFPHHEEQMRSEGNREALERIQNLYYPVVDKKIDTWDIQWNFSIEYHRAYCIWPHTNMIQNIGFDENATHTTYQYNPDKYIMAKGIEFPLKHPDKIEKDDGILLKYKEFTGRNFRPLSLRIKSIFYRFYSFITFK